jgi:three-Cys-motif partner protein
MANVKLDEIGPWSEIKLEIIEKYAKAYSTIIAKTTFIKGHIYIDGFSGAGVHISKETGEIVSGSPLNALAIKPPFSEYHFVDLNSKKIDVLQKLCENKANVYIYNNDCNEILINKVFPRAKYSNFMRALCLLDPYGLHLNWEVIYAAGQMGSIEIFLNFPIMDMNMNILKHDRHKVAVDQIERMNSFWGDSSWEVAAYKKEQGLFEQYDEKNRNNTIADAFKTRLKEKAGFGFVPDPIPMRNTNGSILYYLFFATPNKTAHKIVTQIFNKYRGIGIV